MSDEMNLDDKDDRGMDEERGYRGKDMDGKGFKKNSKA